MLCRSKVTVVASYLSSYVESRGIAKREEDGRWKEASKNGKKEDGKGLPYEKREKARTLYKLQ